MEGVALSLSPTGGAAPAGGPTVLRILLGAQLRRLRESAGISREDAGYHIRASGSKISRMELGRVSFVRRLRDERQFDSVDALIAQMHDDVADTERLLTAEPS